MARDFGFGRTGGLKTLIDSYHSGVDRNRAIDKEKADNQRQGQQWAFSETKNYQKPKLDSNGFVTGYEDNPDTFGRNKPILQKMKPEYFNDQEPAAQPAPKAAPQPEQKPVAQDYTQTPGQELSPTGRPMGKTYDDVGRDPQSSVKPLLVDPAAKQQENQIAHEMTQGNAERQARGQIEEKRLENGQKAIVGKGTTEVEFDPNDPGVSIGRDSKGVDQRVVNATRTVQQFDDGANVIGPANASETTVQQGAVRPTAQGREPQNYNPDAYMMGRITDMATTPTPRASDPMISLDTPAIQAMLKGTELEGVKGQIPATMLKEFLAGKNKLAVEHLKAGKGGANGLSPEQVPFVQMVDKGTEPGDALAEAVKQGVPITKNFSDALYKSQGGKARATGQENAERARQNTQNRLYQRALGGTVKNTTKQWREANLELLNESNYALLAKKMANSGDTTGMVGAIRNMLARASSEKGPLSVYDVQQFGGVDGWAERAEQWLTKGANEGLTPENVGIVNRLADIYIKAANEKAKFKAGPLISELKANVRAEFGDEAAQTVGDMVEKEMQLTIEFGDSGQKDTAPLKDKNGKPVKAMVPGGAPKTKEGLKASYDRTIEAINAKGYKGPQKRELIQKAHDAYQAELKKVK